MRPSTISGVNRLPHEQRSETYLRLVPPELLERFNLSQADLTHPGNAYLVLTAADGASSTEMALYHQPGFPDPVLYGHITDTLTGQVHVLLYVINDPESPRFDVDRMPDGTPTQFGTSSRNIEAEFAAMEVGLAPGQIRRGLRITSSAIESFEQFVDSLGHQLYYVEPLFYHNAIIFERYGFAYQQGRKLMERIHAGFQPGGDLHARLDGSNPFRRPEAANRIRLRSWALHDGILGEPFDKVTMYRVIGRSAGLDTCPGCDW